MKSAGFVEMLSSIEDFWMVANTGRGSFTVLLLLLTFVHICIFTIKVLAVKILQLGSFVSCSLYIFKYVG
jgi:hypothetical protein